MGKYIMALDQGTTSSRCILFDKKGKKDIRKYSEHDKMLLLLKLDNIYGKTKDKNEE